MSDNNKSSKLKLGVFGLVILVVFGLFIYALEGGVESSNQTMLGEPVPEFGLEQLADASNVIHTKAISSSQYTLLNVWASWCAACKEEHGFLLELKKRGFVIYGVNYRDERKAALKVIEELGDPYQFSLFDHQGSLALDLGVIGAPETFLISPEGRIITRFSGVLNEEIWTEKFLPLMKEAG